MTEASFARRAVGACLGFLLMSCTGLVFAWSVFAGQVEVDLGLSRTQNSLVFPISLSISILGQMVAGYIQRRGRPRLSFLAAALLFLVSFLAASRSRSAMELYASYGLMAGLAIGMLYNSVLMNVTALFSRCISTVTGFLLMGFGLGSAAFSLLAAALIERVGWRWMFSRFAFFFCAASLVGGAILPVKGQAAALTSEQETDGQIGPRELVRIPEYRLFFLWCALLISGVLVVSGHAALAAGEIGATPFFAAISVSVNAFANVAARLIGGTLILRIGDRRMKWALTVLALLGALCCLWGYGLRLAAPLLLGYGIIGAVNGGSAVTGNAYVMNRYGRENYGMNMAITNTHLAAASFAGPIIAGVLFTRTGSYLGGFAFMACAVLLSARCLAAWQKRARDA